MSQPRTHVRLLVLAGGLAGLVLVGLLIWIVVLLAKVQTEIVEQNARTRQLVEGSAPTLRRAPGVLEAVGPLAEQLRAGLPQVRRDAREVRGLVRETTPLVDDATRTLMTLETVLPALGELSRTAEPVLRAAGPVLRTAGPVLRGTADFLAETRDRALLRRASGAITTLGRTGALTRSTLQTTRQSLTTQRTTLTRLEESLAIQRQLLFHTRSIDRKLGGTQPAAVTGG